MLEVIHTNTVSNSSYIIQITKYYLVGDGTVIIELLQHLGVSEGGVPLGHMVRVGDLLDQQLGRHLYLGSAAVDLPASRVLATLNNVSRLLVHLLLLPALSQVGRLHCLLPCLVNSLDILSILQNNDFSRIISY